MSKPVSVVLSVDDTLKTLARKKIVSIVYSASHATAAVARYGVNKTTLRKILKKKLSS